MKRLATLSVLIVMAASFAPVHGQDKIEETPYYPLKVGNTWTYTGPNKITLVNKVVAHEKIGTVMCAKIETYVDGKSVAFEHIATTKDGIYRYSLNGMQADKPILILKLPPMKGDEWKIDAKFGNDTVTGAMKTTEEKVTVQGKTYEAYVAGGKLEAGGQTIDAANYFAKDVGVVKIKMDVLGQMISIELDKFEPAK
jgi:hypothetical protein